MDHNQIATRITTLAGDLSEIDRDLQDIDQRRASMLARRARIADVLASVAEALDSVAPPVRKPQVMPEVIHLVAGQRVQAAAPVAAEVSDDQSPVTQADTILAWAKGRDEFTALECREAFAATLGKESVYAHLSTLHRMGKLSRPSRGVYEVAP